MATLPSARFEFKSKAGDTLDFKSAVTVGADGIFTMTIPPQLEDALRGVCKDLKDGSGVYQTPATIRVYAPSLQRCKDLIGKAGEEWAACEITEETVIVYARDIKVAYCIEPDGTIYGNGCGLEPGWRRGGELHAANRSKFYTVGFAAKCMLKRTYTRASSTKVEYQTSPHQSPSHLSFPETYHDKLNGFNCLSMGDPRYMQEMPYTEEAAKFFYEMMAGICALADRMEQFFSDTGNVMRAIEQGKSPLALPGGSNG